MIFSNGLLLRGPRIIGIVQVDNQVVGRIPGFEATIVGTSLPVGTQGLVTEHALIAQCIAIGREVRLKQPIGKKQLIRTIATRSYPIPSLPPGG